MFKIKLNLISNLVLLPIIILFSNTSFSREFYDLKSKDIDGKEIAMSQYKGQVIMVVNVASKCGFTGQYEALEKMYLKYKDKGFVILGFPSNDFLGQEPGSNTEIKKFCSLNYNVTFPLFEKNKVKGLEKQDVYKFLTEETNSSVNGEVSWNFAKFVINKKGEVVDRFAPITKPDSEKVIQLIEKLLNEK